MVLGMSLLAAALAAVPMAQAQDAPAQRGQHGFGGGQLVRGTVTAVAADHLTVKNDSGDTYQVDITANTILMKDRQPVKITDVKAGDGVGVMGIPNEATKSVHARLVSVMDAAEVQKMRENLGKTYIVGKVTAIDMDALKLTILRPDNVSQVIAVDEGTSFRRGGRMVGNETTESGPAEAGVPQTPGDENITLSDIKVGDTIAGQGALKNSIFVPSVLRLMEHYPRHSQRAGNNATAGAGKPSDQ